MATQITAVYEFPAQSKARSQKVIDTLLLAVRTVFLLLGLAALIHLSIAPARATTSEDLVPEGVRPQSVIDQSGVFTDDKPGWHGHEAWIETALREGTVISKKPIGVGVTKPFKVELEWAPGGNRPPIRLAAAFKPIPWRFEPGRRESYQAEVVAYRLSRFLELDRVPPTVVRKIDKETGSLQLWITGVRPYSKVIENGDSPSQAAYVYAQERARMKLFDALLSNVDRNTGNFLVAESWHLILIDHSRTLASPGPRHRDAARPPHSVDAWLAENLSRLDDPTLEALTGDVARKMDRRFLLRQRDRILADTVVMANN